MIKGIEKSLVIWSFWMPIKRILETILIPVSGPNEHSTNFPVVEGDTLPRSNVSPPLNPCVCFHFYVLIKGKRRAWLFDVSESSSRGYWKQFLLSRPYEHSQYLPVVGGWRGGGTIYPGVVSPSPQPSCMLSFLCYDKRDWEEPATEAMCPTLQPS